MQLNQKTCKIPFSNSYFKPDLLFVFQVGMIYFQRLLILMFNISDTILTWNEYGAGKKLITFILHLCNLNGNTENMKLRKPVVWKEAPVVILNEHGKCDKQFSLYLIVCLLLKLAGVLFLLSALK